MIPRFIIETPNKELLEALVQMGYGWDNSPENPVPEYVMVIDQHIVAIDQPTKNPLVPMLSIKYHGEILDQAFLQRSWNARDQKVTLQLGEGKRGKVTISKVGILIDSYIVDVQTFTKFQLIMSTIPVPKIATHTPGLKRDVPFMTIGCDDYSLQDLDLILETYHKLPAH